MSDNARVNKPGCAGVLMPQFPVSLARARTGWDGVAVHSVGIAGFGVPVPPLHGQETSMAREWPLTSFLELGAYLEAVPCARLHARQLLWEWGQGGLGDVIELVVSELITNALRASRSLGQHTTVRFWLLSDKEKVLVMVWDACQRPPTPAEPEPGDISDGGRGLMLVEALSERWAWYFTRETGGKVVWALCGETGGH